MAKMNMGLALVGALGLAGAALWRVRAHAVTAEVRGPRWRQQLGRSTRSRRWVEAVPAWAFPLIEWASQSTGTPPILIATIGYVESRWRPSALSPVGAIGLMQLMPATAHELGVDPHDPAQNVLGGALYLRRMLDLFDDVGLAAAAYNAGPGAVRRHGGVPPFRETQEYVSRVLERLHALAGP